jgi:DNA-binding beta-propeller fold protein YncE
MKMPSLAKSTILGICSLTIGLVISLAPAAAASTVFATNAGAGQLQTIDTSTSVVTPIFNTPGTPEGLTFDGHNQILYTTSFTGQLAMFNTATHSNSILSTLGTNQEGAYVAMDPSGTSALFGVTGVGIERINLTSDAVSPLVNFADPRGMAFDSAGHLFAILGPNQLSQINPTTGAIMNSIALPSTGSAGANGLAFDPVSGNLFLTDDANNLAVRGLYRVGTNLSSATLLAGAPFLFANGLTADGHGNLYIAEANHLDEYNIASDVLTTGTIDSGLFDVALQPSQMTGAPEPGSLVLLGTGLVGLAGTLRRRI